MLVRISDYSPFLEAKVSQDGPVPTFWAFVTPLNFDRATSTTKVPNEQFGIVSKFVTAVRPQVVRSK
jgi:hypothetical protein